MYVCMHAFMPYNVTTIILYSFGLYHHMHSLLSYYMDVHLTEL